MNSHEHNKCRIAMLSEVEALKRGKELGISEYISKMDIFRTLLTHPTLAGDKSCRPRR